FNFFFKAENGIRDRNVTGVQTCALPICLFHPLYYYNTNEIIKGMEQTPTKLEKGVQLIIKLDSFKFLYKGISFVLLSYVDWNGRQLLSAGRTEASVAPRRYSKTYLDATFMRMKDD